jgi:dienelactone hydrolase
MVADITERSIHIPVGSVRLEGELTLPSSGARAVAVFAHGSGSSRHSPRNRYVAGVLQRGGIGTLLFDLLTPQEDAVYEKRFDIDVLTKRLNAATTWLKEQPEARDASIGYFGASTGAAAALKAGAELGPAISAIVSRGGRPDLAEEALERVSAPTLLIVGGYDDVVIRLNQKAFERIHAPKEMKIVPRATHLFEEPGALEEVARLAVDWFRRHLVERQQRAA